MEVTVNNVTGNEQEMEIIVSADELVPHFERAYEKARPKFEIKGFRKGKAPLSMIKRLHGETIEQDSLDEITNDLYRKVVDEKNLEPVGQPVLVNMDYRRGGTLRFRVKYDVKPPFELKQYKGFDVQKTIHPVTDEEVEYEIDRLRRINHSTKEVEKVSDDEHAVTVDLQELDDAGFPIIGKKNENARLYLADPQVFPQIKNALMQTRVGNEHHVRFESSHGEHKHQVFLSVKVKKIEKIQLPEFNSDFVKKVTKGKIETVQQFRKSLWEDLEKFWEEKSERDLSHMIAAEIIKQHDIPVPESMVRAILDSRIEEIRSQQPNKKLPNGFDEEKFRNENRAYAIWQAKWFLIRERILEVEQITVDDADIDALAEQESRNIGIEKDRLVQYYRSSRSAHDKILSDKLMKFLKDNVKIKEVVQTANVELQQ
ncbi:MAG: trigger factor [Bacteroidota bacterium]